MTVTELNEQDEDVSMQEESLTEFVHADMKGDLQEVLPEKVDQSLFQKKLSTVLFKIAG